MRLSVELDIMATAMADPGRYQVITPSDCCVKNRYVLVREGKLAEFDTLFYEKTIVVSAPAEFRGDVLEDAFDRVGVIVHPQLIRDGQEQGVRGGDGFVRSELLDKDIGFVGV